MAREIREADERAQHSKGEYAVAAFDAGQKLIEAKALVKHGQWGGWLRDIGISQRTANRYMRIASSGVELAVLANLGLSAAEKAIPSDRKRRPSAGVPNETVAAILQLLVALPPLARRKAIAEVKSILEMLG